MTAQHLTSTLCRVEIVAFDEQVLSTFLHLRANQQAERAGLSAREHEVLDLMTLGRTRGDMARVLGISPRTVKFHEQNVLRKLGAESRLDLWRVLF